MQPGLLNYLEVQQLEYQFVVSSMPDLWQDNLICEKEAVVCVFFLKSFETYGSEVVCERIRLCDCTCRNCTEAWFPGDRGALLEMSLSFAGNVNVYFVFHVH